MAEILLNNIAITYHIVRSARMSLSMSFKNSTELEVRAPRLMPDFLITQFIKKNENWILRHLEKLQQRKAQRLIPEYKTGITIPFFGEQYPLTISASPLAKIPRLYFIKNTFEAVTLQNLTEKQQQTQLRKVFKDWYLRNTKEKLSQRIAFWAEKMHVTYNNVRIKDVTSHWGSCSSKKNLNFNYRIAMLPMAGIDYIIIHELSHLTEMNHSPRFWKIVEKYMPDYKKIRAELKKKSIDVD